MGRRLYIGSYAGIPVYIHWTFGFVLLFIVYMAVEQNLSLEAGLWFSVTYLSLFLFVILHEYGHALAGKRYGVVTRDIIISPIGGVARMEDMPDKPWKELVIAIAGPMVNVFLAIVLIALFRFVFNASWIAPEEFELVAHDLKSFLRFIIMLNIGLFLFNLIPAFPMDGGRILRALLSMKLGRIRATKIASIIGKIISVLFIGLAVWLSHATLGFIGIFIFYMANMENKHAQMKGKLTETKLEQIMNRNYTMLFESDSIQKAFHFYRQKVSHNFFVFDQDQRPIGVLPEIYIKDYLTKDPESELEVGRVMSSSFGFFNSEENLEKVFNVMNENGWAMAGIKNGDRLIAIVDRQMINSFLKDSKS